MPNRIDDQSHHEKKTTSIRLVTHQLFLGLRRRRQPRPRRLLTVCEPTLIILTFQAAEYAADSRGT